MNSNPTHHAFICLEESAPHDPDIPILLHDPDPPDGGEICPSIDGETAKSGFWEEEGEYDKRISNYIFKTPLSIFFNICCE